MADEDNKLELWQSQVGERLTYLTERLDTSALDIEQLKITTQTLTTTPDKTSNYIRLLTPLITLLFTLVLGTIGLEITTLFFILQHITASHVP